MPELPEVETVRRTLLPLLGETFTSVWSSGKALRLGKPVDLRGLRKASTGARLRDLRRLGKYLLLDLAREPGPARHTASVLVHLGMSGRLRHFSAQSPRPLHTHIEWTLASGGLLRFSDPRRFGQVEPLAPGSESQHPSLARLGPDPLTGAIDPADFHERCQRTRRPIKVALLDQTLVAGVGNIYASEALWQAGIHPGTPAARLTRQRSEALVPAIREVLERALSHGGTSLRDFVDADGKSGEHAHYLWVYDRVGAPCPRPHCSGTIRRFAQQGRATYYCPRCQRR